MSVFNIHHVTRYTYDRPVKESVNEIKIYPYVCETQEVIFHEVNITSHPEILLTTDYWGNKTGFFNLLAAHQVLTIESKLIIRTRPIPLPQLNHSGWNLLENEKNKNLSLTELSQLQETELRTQLSDLASEFCQTTDPIQSIIENCNRYIYEKFSYIKGITTVETTVAEILEYRSGVCQDFAHLMLELLRNLGIPCRYVSGYICPNKNGMRGEGATHAWVEVWLPGLGWHGIDPTNNCWAQEQHVKLAVGRHFCDCSPIKGTFKGPAQQSLSVSVSIGYEDGHHFEELNNVNMVVQRRTGAPPDYLMQMAAQQQ